MNTQDQRANTLIKPGTMKAWWICRMVRQLVIFLRDASGSMYGKKASDASDAGLALTGELAEPVNKDGFHVAVIDFGEKAKVVDPVTKATKLSGRASPLSVGKFGGGTNITAGLEVARSILSDYQSANEDVTWLRPVVILYSDGGHNEGPSPLPVADRVKQKADLVTVAFGSDADEDLLRKMASTPQHFYRCSNGRELRAFLAAVGETMTGTMSTGTNATKALTLVNRQGRQ